MKTIRLSRELKTGVVTVLTIVAFIWGFNYLKGKDLFNNQRTFYVKYNNVSGLMKANAVTISGLNVGQVNDIYFSEINLSQVIVELTVSNNIKIPLNSTARLYSSDLLGTKGIEIVPGNSSSLLESGDTISSDVAMSIQEEVNQMVQPVLKKAATMMSSIDTVISALGDVFNARTRENLRRSIESVRHSVANVEKATNTIDTLMTSEKTRLQRILSNVESISANLNENNEDLSRIISNAAIISDSIAQSNLGTTLANLENSISNLTAATDKINKGEGNIGLLLNDDKLYNDLQSSSKQLDLLLEDIRVNPKRYIHFSVFGRPSKVVLHEESNQDPN